MKRERHRVGQAARAPQEIDWLYGVEVDAIPAELRSQLRLRRVVDDEAVPTGSLGRYRRVTWADFKDAAGSPGGTEQLGDAIHRRCLALAHRNRQGTRQSEATGADRC